MNNKNKRYYDSKKGLQEKVKELEMEVQRLNYVLETARTILGNVPNLSKHEPENFKKFEIRQDVSDKLEKSLEEKKPAIRTSKKTTTVEVEKKPELFECQSCHSSVSQNFLIGDECKSCYDYRKEQEKMKQEEAIRQEQIKSQSEPKPQEQEKITQNQPTHQEQKITSSPPTNEKGMIVCHCGEIAVATKKMSDGTVEGICAPHKEEHEIRQKLQAGSMRQTVAEASERRYKAGADRARVNCSRCAAKDLSGYWNDKFTDNQNTCEECYLKLNPSVAKPACVACSKQDSTVGWFDKLEKNYCENCAKTILNKL